MIEGRTILCFASGYDAPPTSKHHVMHLLAERNTVLWVNYHASRAPTASASDLRYMARKVDQIFRGVTNPWKNLYVLTPAVLALPGSACAKRLNRRLSIGRIRWALRHLQNGPVEGRSFAPGISYLPGNFGEEKVLYYCVDDFASFSGYDREQVRREGADLCRRTVSRLRSARLCAGGLGTLCRSQDLRTESSDWPSKMHRTKCQWSTENFVNRNDPTAFTTWNGKATAFRFHRRRFRDIPGVRRPIFTGNERLFPPAQPLEGRGVIEVRCRSSRNKILPAAQGTRVDGKMGPKVERLSHMNLLHACSPPSGPVAAGYHVRQMDKAAQEALGLTGLASRCPEYKGNVRVPEDVSRVRTFLNNVSIE